MSSKEKEKQKRRKVSSKHTTESKVKEIQAKTTHKRESTVKVEESTVVRDSREIDSYVKKSNKLDSEDTLTLVQYCKMINYLLNKKTTAAKELRKLTLNHSIDLEKRLNKT